MKTQTPAAAPKPMFMFGLSGLMALVLASCNFPGANVAPDVPPQAAYVVMGEDGAAWARAITTDSRCPALLVDGTPLPMQLRVAAGTPALRPTASDPADSKPSAFPVSVCELAMPANAREARIGALKLPVPKAVAQRIVVYGDSGCRMKKAEAAWQACSNPDYWPFEKISNLAAAFHPDLVIHVGDYHYRENQCAANFAGCQGSVWGYGWDAWDADLFVPAAKLMAEAPWVVLRGNHEECRRAGQGWFRFLEPGSFTPQRSCDDARFDDEANYSVPYAVPLGGGQQLIVFDSARAGNAALNPDNAKDANAFRQYQKGFTETAKLAARPGISSMFISHHPMLAFGPAHKPDAVEGGSAALLSVAKTLQPKRYLPPGVDFAIHGHIHLLEEINFSSDHPATLVAGVGGDNLEAPLPNPMPAGASPAEGVTLESIVHTDRFGFVVMDREGKDWVIVAYDQKAAPLTRCRLSGGKIHCDKSGALK